MRTTDIHGLMDEGSDMLNKRLRKCAAALHLVPKPLQLSLGVALVALVANSDEIVSPHVSLGLFYMVPIALITWFVGGVWGMIFAGFSGLAAAFFTWRGMPPSVPTLVIIWSFIAHLLSFAMAAALIWTLQRAIENQRALANTDPITGIGNTRSFRMCAAQELSRCVRQGNALTAVYLDCDNFKTVNDRFGHAGGDLLLRTVAATLTAHVRLTDHVARLGGDEFAMLLPDAGARDAGPLVAKLHRLLLEGMKQNNWPVTFSIGVATFITPPASVDDLLARVDALQYRAKTTGKNKVVYEVVQVTPAPAIAA
jgi:diguanylate cyclase (GGDEF)-like protein